MNDRKFKVLVTKQQLTFSAAHFITFGDNICESLHGHNYSVRCEVLGALNEHGYVADFIALRDCLFQITREMDHKVLLPTKHPTINVSTQAGEVTATFEERRWLFPKNDCLMLPVTNTTAELLASYIADRMIAVKTSWATPEIETLSVGVDENQGQWGTCDLTLRSQG